MDGITFQKLRDIEARFGEVEASMADPAVVQDQAAYQKLARESKEISPIVERFRSYKDTLQELTKVQEMARAEGDPELREMAQEEARSLEAKRDELDAGIPLLLVPKDPRSAPAPAATRRACSRPRCSACTRASRSRTAGRSTSSRSTAAGRAASRR